VTTSGLTYRLATADEASELTALVRSAYRGDESRAGWTTEADLLADERIDVEQMRDKIARAEAAVLTIRDPDENLVACCEVVDRGAGLAYFGMFAVRPTLQSAGIGGQVLAAAERYASERWDARRMEMTVIGQREDLIAWYLRRGYTRTDEHRPFPYDELVNGEARRDDLYFTVLVKDLA
jgi:GNAT superfamily N-acetyltransferase